MQRKLGDARDPDGAGAKKRATEGGGDKYRTFFENAADFFYIHDFEGNLIETNLASKMNTSYSDEEIARMNIKDIMPEAYRALFDEYMKQVKTEGRGNRVQKIRIFILQRR